MFSDATHFYAFLLTHKRVTLNTYNAYKADVEMFMLFLKHRTSISTFEQLTTHAIEDFFKELKRRHFSQKSMIRFAATLRALGRYLAESNGRPSPLADIKISGAGKNLPRHCSEKDISFLLDSYCAVKDQRNNLIMHLLYATGIRVSELCSLEIKDIDVHAKVLTVVGKRGKQRKVPLTDDMLACVKSYTAGKRLEKLVQAGAYNTPYLFPVFRNGKAAAITRSMVWRIVKKAFLIASAKNSSLTVQNAFPHLFRHALATHLVKHDWDLRSVQLLLGHENITTVEIYTHIDASHIKKIYEKKHPRARSHFTRKKEDL